MGRGRRNMGRGRRQTREKWSVFLSPFFIFSCSFGVMTNKIGIEEKQYDTRDKGRQIGGVE